MSWTDGEIGFGFGLLCSQRDWLINAVTCYAIHQMPLYSKLLTFALVDTLRGGTKSCF